MPFWFEEPNAMIAITIVGFLSHVKWFIYVNAIYSYWNDAALFNALIQ
jgi:hypothetical protein